MEEHWIPGLSPVAGRIVVIIAILIISALVARLTHFTMSRIFGRYTEVLRADPTIFNFVKNISSALIYLVGIAFALSTIPEFRALTVSVFAGAGVLAAVIGFAAQKALANVVSGLFIVVFKPFRINDVVELDSGYMGYVEDITIRHTVIRNYENQRIVIPNSKISDTTIINYHLNDERICRFVKFTLPMDSDYQRAMEIIQEESTKHPYTIDVRSQEEVDEGEPIVKVRIVDITHMGLVIRANVWTRVQSEAFQLNCDLNLSIKKRLDEENIPLSQFTIP